MPVECNEALVVKNTYSYFITVIVVYKNPAVNFFLFHKIKLTDYY